jgi:hypothetical protein
VPAQISISLVGSDLNDLAVLVNGVMAMGGAPPRKNTT